MNRDRIGNWIFGLLLAALVIYGVLASVIDPCADIDRYDRMACLDEQIPGNKF